MKLRFKKQNLLIHVLVALVLFLPLLSFADSEVPISSKIVNPLGSDGPDNINDFIKTALEAVIKIGLPLVALAIIYSGFLFVFAMGNSEKLKTAKNALLYSVIGAVILLGAWAIAQMISDTVKAL